MLTQLDGYRHSRDDEQKAKQNGKSSTEPHVRWEQIIALGGTSQDGVPPRDIVSRYRPRSSRQVNRGPMRPLFVGRFRKILIAVIDFVPVHHVPPGREILRTPVVVFQVVGVFPNVVAKNREQAL